MNTSIEYLLESRNPFIRKGTAYFCQTAKIPFRLLTTRSDYEHRPPIIVNSLPKSGTHLLLQIARAVPNTHYLGGFIAHAWSVSLRERSPRAIRWRLNALLPGEVVGAHIRHHPDTGRWFSTHPAIHLFIYRDPRDVVLSEEIYLTKTATWHRLHRKLRQLPSRAERLRLLIGGIPPLLPDLGTRVRSFTSWLQEKQVIGIKYEDLQGHKRQETLQKIAEQICSLTPLYGSPPALARKMEMAINPARSHTYREGGVEKWRQRLPGEILDYLMEIAGNEIARLGYPAT